MTDELRAEIKEVLTLVYNTLKDHGYNPIDQIMGYLRSGDETYISNYNDARAKIRHYDIDDVMDVILTTYFS